MHSFPSSPLPELPYPLPELSLFFSFRPIGRTSISSSSPSAVLVLCPRWRSIDFNPRRLLLCIFPLTTPVYSPFLSVCVSRKAALLHFPLTRWEKLPRRLRCGLPGATPSWIALTQKFFAPPAGKYRARLRLRGDARIVAVVYDYRPRKTMRALALANVCASSWRLALRIMLSTTYALRSATSAKSRREFYCGAARYAR